MRSFIAILAVFLLPATLAFMPNHVSANIRAPALEGRGDKRTAKGKRFAHSFGKSRPRKDKKSDAAEGEEAK